MTKDPVSEMGSPGVTPVGHAPDAHDTAFFGHPRGLATLFFTEMWERLSYYGMRALLVLFMTAAAAQGGLGYDEGKASAIYGLYTAGVYLLALPGGWLADRLFGQQKAVLYGGIIIALGHFSMAVPTVATFFLGMILIVIGTGLLKPNISAIVGELYAEGDERRDAGFSLFYMGINIGAFLAPIVCGTLGEKVGWHWGFGAAGVGMLLGVIQYAYGRKYLGTAGAFRSTGLPVDQEARRVRKIYLMVGIALVLFTVLGLAMAYGVLPVSAEGLANAATGIIVGAAVLFFLYLFMFGELDPTEKKRVGAVALLFVFSALFWSGFEQAGSSMNLFARDITNRIIGGWEFPASWLQFVNPAFIILLAPVFAALWSTLGRRNPSIPVKFGLGLILLGFGFLVLVAGANAYSDTGDTVTPWFLITAYLLHTCGELCISPVGLSTVTKLAPQRFASQLMGVWFISISLGNLMAGLVAGQIEELPMSEVFFMVFIATGAGGLLLLLMSPVVNKLTGGIK